jgi:flagellar hook-associated protein 1 FlgK
MTSPFFGLDLATRALRAQQTLVDITDQNVANANTPGYSRQSGQVQATLAYPIPVFRASGAPGQLGTGVEVTTVTRARDTYVDYQIRGQFSSQGRWDTRSDALKQIEAIVNEPSSSGLSALLGKYFKSWQEVSNNPADASVRANLLEQGKAVTSAFQNLSSQLRQQQQDLDHQVSLTVTNINDYASQIANINKQISQVETSGMHANDLRDQRDNLLDDLSKLVKITTVESSEGSVSVYIGNHQLVDRAQTHSMGVDGTSGVNVPVWTDVSPNQPVTPGDGQLQGYIEARDQIDGDQLTSLNQLAQRVMESVNSVHESGVGLNGVSGTPFFTGTDASNISINSTLTAANGTDYLAAARTYWDAATGTYQFAKGDGTNAIALAELQNAVAQRSATPPSNLAPGSTFASPPTTVLGADFSGAQAGTTYTLTVAGSTVSVNGSAASVTVGADATGANQIITVDGSGVRLTLSAANGTPLNSVLANLNNQSISTVSAPATIGDQYGQLVAALGVDSSTAQGESANQKVLIDHLDNQRQQTSGVSLDEEATKLIAYQRGYQAAARVVTVVDEMLDTLINSTGRVGR